ncbi:hypothetical protein COL154_013064 [Colletotrichum chrysophilum]|uniref:uncharacterized protein n=1 Tax=Colletotrichum chrysophilum TaxID=1836956 RepID=UPI0022FFE40F|nr:uncharacterized protein COL26b_006347 [Colletotrichum chrysophilum]KAJ0337526.1 hypothetical protein KNSL1_012830 [Colletotrichum chrysophilum]KAJ0351055.1 hypothetical protein COL154_013064 [Colletotrichum chrysophilum]KAJ0375466.1 hypothetical protein COL26b_006347 [Colletotrichum chrysophilum]
MINIRLHQPVQIPAPVFHQMRKVGFDQYVDCETAPGLGNEWNLKRLDCEAAGAVSPEDILRSYREVDLGKVIPDVDQILCVRGVMFPGHKFGVKPDDEAMMRCKPSQYRLEQSLRDVHRIARTCKFIVAL